QEQLQALAFDEYLRQVFCGGFALSDPRSIVVKMCATSLVDDFAVGELMEVLRIEEEWYVG
ncbi:unnamed protein product, partial [Amoebophrya sp. A25]